jgi:hypothetical protein
LDNSLIYKYQSGFMRGHSTVHQLIEIYHNICLSIQWLIRSLPTAFPSCRHSSMSLTSSEVICRVSILLPVRSWKSGVRTLEFSISVKKGIKSDPSNYRPISLLSCVGKVFKRVVFKYIFNFLLDNSLIYKYQSGFMREFSISVMEQKKLLALSSLFITYSPESNFCNGGMFEIDPPLCKISALLKIGILAISLFLSPEHFQ